MKKILLVLIAGLVASAAYAGEAPQPSCEAVSILAKSFAEDRNAGVKYMEMRRMIATQTAKNPDRDKGRIVDVAANKVMDAVYKEPKYNAHQTPAQIGELFLNECKATQ